MAADADLQIILSAKDLASSILKNTSKNAKQTGIDFKAAFAVAGAAATTLTGVMSDLAREGAEDAATMDTLRQAVENTGAAWDEAAASEFIDKMRDTRAIADDQLKPALAGLVAITGDYTKAMDLSALAADIARGKNISLQSAADLVGKVAQGNLGTLSRYGIVLGEGATATEALAVLQQKFAGQAEAYGKTTAGSMEIMGLKIGDFREEIGQTMGPAMGLVGMLPGLSAGFSMAGGAVGGLMSVFPGLAGSITGKVVPALGMMNVALGPIGLAILAIGAIIALFAVAWSNNWGDIQGKTQAVCDFLGNAFESLKTMLTGIWNGIRDAIKAAINAIIGFINGLITAWNGLQFTIPGFEMDLFGQKIGWGGLSIGTPDIPTIPYLAAGGIITRPTVAMVGERGPEAVVPLNGNNELVATLRRIEALLARGNTIELDGRALARGLKPYSDNLVRVGA